MTLHATLFYSIYDHLIFYIGLNSHFICVCVCVSLHTHTHTHTYIYIHTHTHTYIHTYIYVVYFACFIPI